MTCSKLSLKNGLTMPIVNTAAQMSSLRTVLYGMLT